jgi:hypothetical protein
MPRYSIDIIEDVIDGFREVDKGRAERGQPTLPLVVPADLFAVLAEMCPAQAEPLAHRMFLLYHSTRNYGSYRIHIYPDDTPSYFLKVAGTRPPYSGIDPDF